MATPGHKPGDTPTPHRQGCLYALAHIKRLALTAKDREGERALYMALRALQPYELVDVLALVKLGRAGHRSFNGARAAAQHQNLEHAPGMLADNRHFAKYLNAGLKR